MFLFHVATEADWAAAQAAGCYERSTYGRSLAEVGFVHASASHAQLDGVLSGFYADVREPLRLLVIDPNLLNSPWQMDAVPGAVGRFPHVYGPVNLDAVVDTAPLTLGEGGWSYPWLTPRFREDGPIQVRSATRDCFALKVGDETVGFVALGRYRTGESEITYGLVPGHEGHGYARAGLKLVTDWLFATRPDLRRLVSVTSVDDERRRRLLETTGWREARRFVDGEPQVMFELLAPKVP